MSPARRLATALVVIVLVAAGLGCSARRVGPAGEQKQSVPLPASRIEGLGRVSARLGSATTRLDPTVGLCELVGVPGVYLASGWFLRRGDAGWERSRWSSGPWRAMGADWQPPPVEASAASCSASGD